MLVRMLVNYGENWPAAGDTIDLADAIAQELLERGEAVAAKAPKVTETATLDDAPETATVKRGRPRKAAGAS